MSIIMDLMNATIQDPQAYRDMDGDGDIDLIDVTIAVSLMLLILVIRSVTIRLKKYLANRRNG